MFDIGVNLTSSQFARDHDEVVARARAAGVHGMLLTPPDVFSQTLLAIPMYCLFEVGVFFARFYTGKRLTRDDDAAAEAEAAEHREE